MSLSTRWAVSLLGVLSVIGLQISCSSAPKGPEKGTPAFYWAAARETYTAGDYMKTIEHLDNVLATENEFTARALPWSLALTSGTVAGYMELADDYAIGARANKSDPSSFRRQVSNFRGSASRLALEFAENYSKIDKLKPGPVTLDFAYPKGSAAPVAALNKVTNGILLPPADTEAVQKRGIERGVVLAVCRMAGAPDDSAKTEQILKTGTAEVPRDSFLMAMAVTLYNESQLFAPDKLDDPQKASIFVQRAKEALAKLPETKETKELSLKLDKSAKKGKKV